MSKLVLSALVTLLMISAPSYRLDPGASDVSAKVSFLGLASKKAKFPALQGSITLDPADRSKVDLRVELDARKLQAPDGVTLKRLKGEKFFWVERYPMVSFRGTTMALKDERRGRIDGTITARGVTRPVSLEVLFDRPVSQFDDGKPVRIDAETEIDRTDFGMRSYRSIVGKTVTIRISARMLPLG